MKVKEVLQIFCILVWNVLFVVFKKRVCIAFLSQLTYWVNDCGCKCKWNYKNLSNYVNSSINATAAQRKKKKKYIFKSFFKGWSDREWNII